MTPRTLDVLQKETFETFFEQVMGHEIADIPDDWLTRFYALWCHQSERLLDEMNNRGLIIRHAEGLHIPYYLPDGVTVPPVVRKDPTRNRHHA